LLIGETDHHHGPPPLTKRQCLWSTRVNARSPDSHSSDDPWIALAIGNSRLHWAQFNGEFLQRTWDTPHVSTADVQRLIASQFTATPHCSTADPLPLYIASVVPHQSQLWHGYPAMHRITLDNVPLKGLYPTLGIDRALALWGAIVTVGSPVLVIDAGTALTFTGADAAHQLVGGAILPGVGLQFHSLNQATAALPDVSAKTLMPQNLLPQRWALNTDDAIASGILYTVLAGLRDFVESWWQQFPASPVMLRGGDSDRLHHYLTASAPDLAIKLSIAPHLIFEGMRAVKGRQGDKGICE